MRRTFFWHIFPAALLPALLALAVVAAGAIAGLRHYDIERSAVGLEARARLLARNLQALEFQSSAGELQRQVRDAGRETQTRFTVVAPDGRVLADSEADPARMENHGFRPEVSEALQGRVGRDEHFSRTLFERHMYIAVPFIRGDRVAAAVRASIPLTLVEKEVRSLRWRILGIGGLAALLMGLWSWRVSRGMSRPVERLTVGAERFAAGDLAARMAAPEALETERLAAALNTMAGELDRRLNEAIRQRNAQAAILASMVEGVVAVDEEGRIAGLNPAAARSLGLVPEQAYGRMFPEAIRHSALAILLTLTRTGSEPTEDEVQVSGEGEERILHVHGNPIRNAQGRPVGAVLVLHDITALRRMENLRRDFVANVSHEFKTPLTAIAAAAETLMEDDLTPSIEGQRFAGAIRRQAERLNRLVQDVLDLSRIEHEAERGRVSLSAQDLAPILELVRQAQDAAARARAVQVDVQGSEDLRIAGDSALLELAVGNLLDNAIKFSPDGGRVTLRAERRGAEVVIEVADQGPGIAAEHLPRLFERFYRVDRGRDRRTGGTGLGLAIVKHVVLAHGGRVSVDSAPGRGSVFRMHLPAV